jgi:hypothetical protein
VSQLTSDPPVDFESPLVILSPEPVRAMRNRGKADRLATLHGCKVGLLDNNKPGAAVILRRLGARLAENGASEVHLWAKSLPSGPSPYVTEAVKRTDVLISGVGDCGSCSSWSLRDALEAELLGRPTVTLVSEPFFSLVTLEAEALGIPGMNILSLPHPLATLAEARLEAIADYLFDRVVEALVRTR